MIEMGEILPGKLLPATNMTSRLVLPQNVLDNNKTAFINIKIGEGITFTFNNQKWNPPNWKKKSPSQHRRDKARMNQFKEIRKEKEAKEDSAKLDSASEDTKNDKFVT